MQNLNCSLLVFDWDGTLFDSAGSIVQAVQAAAVEVGIEKPSYTQASYVIGLGLHDAMRHIAPDLNEASIQKLIQAYLNYYRQHAADITLFEGVHDMLNALKQRGHLLAVATGKSRAGLNEALKISGLHTVFDTTRTAEQTAGKPNPRMLHEIMNELGCTKAQTLMIGDTSHDLGMAQNAHCASIGVSYGAHRAQGLERFAPKHIARSIEDLQHWLLANA